MLGRPSRCSACRPQTFASAASLRAGAEGWLRAVGFDHVSSGDRFLLRAAKGISDFRKCEGMRRSAGDAAHHGGTELVDRAVDPGEESIDERALHLVAGGPPSAKVRRSHGKAWQIASSGCRQVEPDDRRQKIAFSSARKVVLPGPSRQPPASCCLNAGIRLADLAEE